MNNRNKKVISALWALVFLFGCTPFLDVVPDNEVTLDDIYKSRASAYAGLAKMYSYIPDISHAHNSEWLLGDEYIGRIDLEYSDGINAVNVERGIRIMRGLQSTSAPQLGYWSGNRGGSPLYEGIRACNIFLENIDKVPMGEREREEWRSQGKFLKAYFHFLLLRNYGPIIIADKSVSLDALRDDLFQRRTKVDECFDFILDLIEQSLEGNNGYGLSERLEDSDLGMVDRAAVMAMKARILLFRASPFFNGNMEYFGDFYDFDGETYFSMEQNEESRKAKWKAAADAAYDAIQYVTLQQGRSLYLYEGVPYTYDTLEWRLNTANMQKLYDLRMVLTDPWNRELLWGYSNIAFTGQNELQCAANMRVPSDNYMNSGVNINTAFSWQWMAASYNVASRYYTKNGLPIEEDPAFNTNTMFNITNVPDISSSAYTQWHGILQPGHEIPYFYLDREPRFYANIAITGGYWRTQFIRIPTAMYADKIGGRVATYEHAYFCTGMGIKKIVHPESKSGNWQRVVRYPYPIIRLADLYLIYAEALNEYLDAPNPDVWGAVNEVRLRAGIPTVQDSWSVARVNTNKHLNKIGMRDIILRERSIELAFEGSRYWDMWRHRMAVREFNRAITGWNALDGTEAESFFVLQPKQIRRFSIRDCLWPIDLNELNTNSNLKQNPGW